MKIEEKVGDVVQAAQSGDYDVLLHGCNCFCVMGAGAALAIRRAFPAAYDADCQTQKGDRNKLGTLSSARFENGFRVVNCYTQYRYGRDPNIQYLDMNALGRCMERVNRRFAHKRIVMPPIGSGLANGNWEEIKRCLEETLVDVASVTVVMELPAKSEKICIAFRHEKSHHGHSLQTLKSWLQKSIRRGQVFDAVYATIEICSINIQRVITNLMTRLRVIALEDVGIACYRMVLLLEKEFEKEYAGNGKRRIKAPIDGRMMEKFIRISQMLARAPHIRLASDYNAVFMKPYDVQSRLEEQFPAIYQPYQKTREWLREKRTIQEEASMLKRLLIEQNDGAFFVVAAILERELLPFRTFGSFKPAYFIMDILLKLARELPLPLAIVQTISTLVVWMKDGMALLQREANLPIQYSVLLLLKRNQLSEEVPTHTPHKDIYHFSDPARTPPDYVLDVHTREGRAEGKDACQFVKEVNEATDLLNEEYRKVYIASKEIESHPLSRKRKRESEYCKLLVRAQVNTADSRSDAYFATEHESGRCIFIKGPYVSKEKADIPVRILNVKQLCMPTLEVIHLQSVALMPDQFDTTPLGCRRYLPRDRPSYFLVADSLVEMPIPTRIHNTKVWKDELVVDWSRVNGVQLACPFDMEADLLRQYVENILFRYVMGIPDAADRNFLIHKGCVISTDEEGINRSIVWKQALRGNRMRLVMECIFANHEHFQSLMKEWYDNLVLHQKFVCELLQIDDIEWMMERVRRGMLGRFFIDG